MNKPEVLYDKETLRSKLGIALGLFTRDVFEMPEDKLTKMAYHKAGLKLMLYLVDSLGIDKKEMALRIQMEANGQKR